MKICRTLAKARAVRDTRPRPLPYLCWSLGCERSHSLAVLSAATAYIRLTKWLNGRSSCHNDLWQHLLQQLCCQTLSVSLRPLHI